MKDDKREKKVKSPDDVEEAMLKKLEREERKTLSKEVLDDMQDYADFMMGTGKYADKETK